MHLLVLGKLEVCQSAFSEVLRLTLPERGTTWLSTHDVMG